jgi:hypothetical protein
MASTGGKGHSHQPSSRPVPLSYNAAPRKIRPRGAATYLRLSSVLLRGHHGRRLNGHDKSASLQPVLFDGALPQARDTRFHGCFTLGNCLIHHRISLASFAGNYGEVMSFGLLVSLKPGRLETIEASHGEDDKEIPPLEPPQQSLLRYSRSSLTYNQIAQLTRHPLRAFTECRPQRPCLSW